MTDREKLIKLREWVFKTLRNLPERTHNPLGGGATFYWDGETYAVFAANGNEANVNEKFIRVETNNGNFNDFNLDIFIKEYEIICLKNAIKTLEDKDDSTDKTTDEI